MYAILIAEIVAFVVVLYWAWTVKFQIDYANDNAVNSTEAQKIAQTMIQAQTVPTIINGITTATSIIVAFSIGLIGIMFRGLFKDNQRAKEVFVIFAVLFVFSLAFLFSANVTLATGGNVIFGKSFLETAWTQALVGFAISLFLLLFVFTFIANEYENAKPTKEATTEEKETKMETKTEQKEPEITKPTENGKNVNSSLD